MEDKTFKLLYWKTCDLWKRLCEIHQHILELTLEEYSLLLNSDVDGIEVIVDKKQDAIQDVAKLEVLRTQLIAEINKNSNLKISNITELILAMAQYEKENGEPHLEKFNLFLIDLIEQIQEQNRKNQVFINRTLHSLKSIRESAMGKKNYSTYTAQGSSTKTATP